MNIQQQNKTWKSLEQLLEQQQKHQKPAKYNRKKMCINKNTHRAIEK